MTPDLRSLTGLNRAGWDRRTPFHVRSKFYGAEEFLQGTTTLKQIELDLCGEVAGRDLLHLQCHFGLDSLSWARRGARVTGIDFSPVALESARQLARAAKLEARFVEADATALGRLLAGGFDVAVSTYGALCWLPSLAGWATGIAASLRPGGRLVLVELHPFLDVVHAGCVSGAATYFAGEPAIKETSGTYADRHAQITYTQVLWQHPTSEVISALAGAGLRIEAFAEYPYCSYPIVPELRVERDGYWHPEGGARLPYLYSVVAEK